LNDKALMSKLLIAGFVLRSPSTTLCIGAENEGHGRGGGSREKKKKRKRGERSDENGRAD